MEYIQRNINILKDRIFSVCNKIGRSPEEIFILPITKGVDVNKIKYLYDLGFKEFGENRVKETLYKYSYLPSDITWHLVGYLQSNKVKKALEIYKVIQSIDRISIIDEIDRRNVKIDVFVEFNCSGEENKHGFVVEMWKEVFDYVLSKKNLNVIGIMTLGPYPVSENTSRRTFEKLRNIRDKLRNEYKLELKLSMGMSEDFEYAIMEGADIIRIGRLIFDESFNIK
ncbi:MAG: YggS family pyridoxal phosphate-dependent enzyme [candidate division WOR-3 bacterium]|nr:YggS family pyridoxal phosphate-dependent enzyme [candidate division WOR-3 bacterium]MCX7947522.1 YggS family pyridoxal phosphate-dependent enzyme [candidate division WOR-3 bacterium]MDW8150408.1 YggS family pyridoxal phosphate-dependent enzyme [candidate division WOR-3 bacterium]